jgi:RNA recognition motif-containing protein
MNEKLYVGNLAYTTTEDDLRQLFAQAGAVTACDLVKERDTDRSRGFAFVTMSTQAEAENAVSLFNAYSLGERSLTVNIAKPRAPRPAVGSPGGARASGRSRR